MEREPEHCCFDDWVDDWVKQARKKGVARQLTANLLDALDDAGLDDRTMLDLGCGIGDLSIGALARGAASARGYDLSPKAISAARALADERGVAGRTAFEVGDASTAELPPADVVALHRVFCCYPDVRGLLERSLAAAGSVYAFTVPSSNGVIGGYDRVQAAIANAWYRMRPRTYGGFRVYIHDVGAIDERVRAEGFRLLRRERRRVVWQLAVYTR
ncbi:MAG: class I SAM-dependent methyltransferase [Actinobacteria bacterium]|nr:class I SAM-dependent methyltransferase [Actinomycetota bacterium]